jgi:hypothetical protein
MMKRGLELIVSVITFRDACRLANRRLVISLLIIPENPEHKRHEEQPSQNENDAQMVKEKV